MDKKQKNISEDQDDNINEEMNKSSKENNLLKEIDLHEDNLVKEKENTEDENKTQLEANNLEEETKGPELEDGEDGEDGELTSLRDEKLRLLAEMENLRRRSEKEKKEAILYGSTNFARDILNLGDNLSRALDNLPKEEENSREIINNLIDGIKMVQKDFINILSKFGIKKIESINQKFDHNLHQAMFEIETEEKEEGFVVQEVQSGYLIHDRLLRPSMVGVSKKPKKS